MRHAIVAGSPSCFLEDSGLAMLFRDGPAAGSYAPSRPGAWLLAALAIKLALYVYAMTLANRYLPQSSFYWYQPSGDEASYTAPAENLLSLGTYLADPGNPWSGVFRMPGYSLTYLLFRIPLGPEHGKAALILFQVLVGGIAAYLTARIAGQVTGRRGVFLAAFWLATLSISSSIFDSYTITDSLATNALVVSIWLLLPGSRQPEWRAALLAGTIFAYAVFLRPIFLPLILALAAFVWFSWPPRMRSRAVSLLLAVPVLALTVWTGRNFALVGRLVPLQAGGLAESAAERAVWEWVQSFGGDIVFWRPGTVMAWVLRTSYAPAHLPVPPSVLTGECGADQVSESARLYRVFREETSPRRKAALELAVVEAFDRCREAYVSAHPFDHQVTARLRLLRSFFGHSGAVLPLPRFSQLALISMPALFKLFCAGIYALVLTSGLVGLVVLVKQRTAPAVLIAVVPCYFVVLLPLILRRVETRYIAELWPFLCVASAVALARFADWLPRWRPRPASQTVASPL